MKKLDKEIPMFIRGFIVIFLFFNSYLFQYIPVYLFHMDIASLNGNLRMAALFSVFSEIIMAFILLLIYRKDLIRDFGLYIQNFKNYFSLGFKAWISGLAVMMVSNSFLSTVLHSQGANNEIMVRSLATAIPFIMAFNLCLFAPFVEEIVFRKTFKDAIQNKWIFVIVSFLVFGLVHVSSSATNIVDWLYIVPYGALGGFFAYVDYETDNIFTSIMFHMIHNTLVYLIIILL